jgi:aspartyl-tRNA(Asn)/glutamyl-tRNA(Gln) amidotransferase subunit A
MLPTVGEAIAEMDRGRLSSAELVHLCLNRIEALNPRLNAFISVLSGQAAAEARQMDEERRRGKLRGPLHGIPIAVKDNIDVRGARCTAASAVFDERIAEEDAEVLRRLRAAGAIVLGKTNMQEFGLGSTSVDSYFGPVRNPWDQSRHPGGSSGGSACAVAAGMCCAALGTDTGGSVRTPATYCGVVGLKATYGLVPLRGIIPAKLSLDHCGPLARTAEDAALMLNVMAGYDPLDIASVHSAAENYAAALKQPVAGLRIGIPRAPFFDHVEPAVARIVEDAIAVVARLTAGVQDVALPPVSHISMAGETYAYHQPLFERNANRYTPHARRAITNDSKASAADYIRSRWQLELLRRNIDASFEGFDAVVLPTRRRLPLTIEEYVARDESEKAPPAELENTGALNVYGIPAITVPCGFTLEGLPVGFTIAGPRFSEGRILALAHAYQHETDWHRREPLLNHCTSSS